MTDKVNELRRQIRIMQESLGRPMEIAMKTVWVAGKSRCSAENGQAWDLQGVFDSESLAEAACKTPEDFIGPVQLNEELPQDAMTWPGVRYPHSNSAV